MDWIVTTGATIDAALESALDELSVTHDDVEYEILKQPSFSLLRLRRHPAQVRTRVKPVEPPAKREWRRPPKNDRRSKAKSSEKRKQASKKKRDHTPRDSNQNKTKDSEKKKPQPNKASSTKSSTTRKRTISPVSPSFSSEDKEPESNIRSTKQETQAPDSKSSRRTRKIDY